jgi:regulator of replication initiation timing
MLENLFTIPQLIQAGKYLKELDERVKDHEAKHALSELYKQLIVLNVEYGELLLENKQLKQRIDELESNVDSVTLRDGLYYKEGNEHPFCPACFSSKKTVPLAKTNSDMSQIMGIKWECGVCKTRYS